MLLNALSKRLGVMVFYDKDNIIDDYVIFMLDAFKEACDDLIIVSNTPLNDDNLARFKTYSDKILVRQNRGLDAGAFKDVYDHYHEEFANYDELILINDTFYGPFDPFKDINAKMADKDLDFWGLCASYECENGFGSLRSKQIPAHIQTFFVAYRSTVLRSKAFKQYWENYSIDDMDNFERVVTKHETYFTHYLEMAGFKWDTYLDLSAFKADYFKNNYNIYAYSAYQLIKYYHAPFIKRKNFIFERNDALFLNDGTDTIKAFNYLKERQLYDPKMILKNLVRLYTPSDLYQGMNLNYVLDHYQEDKQSTSLILIKVDSEVFKDYLKDLNLKGNIQYINENIMTYLSQNKTALQAYDYLFILNLVDDLQVARSVSDTNFFRIIDNTIASDEMVQKIQTIFNSDEYLGGLLAPISYHYQYFNELSGRYFKDAIKKRNLKYRPKDFIAANPGFIVLRSAILSDLNDNHSEDDMMIYELLGQISKHQYYAGKVYTQIYLSNDVTGYEKMFGAIFADSKKHYTYPMVSVSSAGLIHRWIRKHLSLETRKKLKRKLKRA